MQVDSLYSKGLIFYLINELITSGSMLSLSISASIKEQVMNILHMILLIISELYKNQIVGRQSWNLGG